VLATSPRPRGRIDTTALKQAHPIQEVVTRYGIELRPQGQALVGRCPLHADGGRPNLYVYPRTQTWRCYRCAVGGDVLSFVQLVEQVSFREAVDRLGGAQIPPRPASPRIARPPFSRSEPRAEDVSDTAAVLRAATSLYHQRLLGDGYALAYLAQRGIDRPTVERCQVGYAAGDQLLPVLRWRGLPLWGALRAGLINRHGHEQLAGRIVVPELHQNQPTWLIGRLLEADAGGRQPRYLGLPGRKPLLGWEQAQREPSVVLVEGVFDWLTLRMWGYPALALLGTDLRIDLIGDLRRVFQRIYLVPDNDDAGLDAAERLLTQLDPIAVGVLLPDGIKDVAELAPRPDGRALFDEALLASVGSSSAHGPDAGNYALT
jgi:DNA primase